MCIPIHVPSELAAIGQEDGSLTSLLFVGKPSLTDDHPHSSPVKYVPAWFPGAEFKRLSRTWQDRANKLLNDQVGIIYGS